MREVPSAKRRAAVDYRVIDVRSGALAHPYARQLLNSSKGYDRAAVRELHTFD